MRVLLFLFLWWPISALADWQWTKWGMSPEEVVSASREKARLATDDEKEKQSVSAGSKVTQLMLAVSEHDSGDLRFRVLFLFDPVSRQLMCVRLDPGRSTTAARLRSDLIGVYGKPVDEKRDNIVSGIWIARSIWVGEDRIELLSTSTGSATISYCNRRAGQAGGL